MCVLHTKKLSRNLSRNQEIGGNWRSGKNDFRQQFRACLHQPTGEHALTHASAHALVHATLQAWQMC